MQSASFKLTSELVRAGAGAGKTTRLIQKVTEGALDYKKHNGVWPRVVVTTFTRKATQELKERLVVEACERKSMELLKFINSPSLLQISTLHGVFNQFLKKYAHLIDIDPGFKLIDESEHLRMAKLVVKDMGLGDSRESFNFLSAYYDFNLLTQLCLSYSEFAMESKSADHFLMNDHINRYKKECESYARSGTEVSLQILEQIENEKWITYAQKLKIFSTELNAAELDGAEYLEYLKSLGSKPRVNKDIPAEVNDLLADYLKQMKKHFCELRMQKSQMKHLVAIAESFKKFAEEFHLKFKELKKKKGELSMSDLELYTLEAIQNYPDVVGCYRAEWDYWLVDEFQDTSPVQVQILDELTKGKAQFIVGDPQQSIYLFRGARSEVFFERQKDFEKQKKNIDILEKNYRSEPELLMFFNSYFSSLKGKFTDMYPREEVKNPGKSVAQVNIAPLNDQGLDKSLNEKRSVYYEIQKLINAGHSYSDICILSRTNKELLDLSRFLSDRNCPVYLNSSTQFFDRREVSDASALLKFLVNPADNLNLMVLLRSPWCKIKDEILVDILDKKEKKYWHFIKEKLKDNEIIKKLESYLASCNTEGVSQCFQRALTELGYFDFCFAQDVTGRKEANLWKLIHLLAEQEKTPGFNYIDFIKRTNSKANLIEDGHSEGDAVAAFEPDCINLMTVHASKGLQFKFVFVISMGKKPQLTTVNAHKQLFHAHKSQSKWGLSVPGAEDKMSYSLFDRDLLEEMDLREIEEFNRLLYVALTRAKEKVFLSWVDYRIDKKSWASLCPLDLSEGIHNKEHFSYEVSLGPWGIGELEAQQKNIVEIVRAPLVFENKEPEVRFSVSSLLEEGSVLSQDKVTPQPEASNYKEYMEVATTGSLVHKLMELLQYSLEISDSYLERWFGEKQDVMRAALDYVLSCENPPLMDIIETGFVEWGFQMKTQKGIMEGQIDLWGEVDGVVWVIDYKSGSDKFKEKAFKQLQFYARALEEKLGHNNIKLAVVYPLKAKSYIKSYESIEI